MTDHLTRRFGYTIAAVQLGAGLTGCILGASHFAGVSYHPAKELLRFLPGDPSTWWSGLLAVLGAVAIAVLAAHHDRAIRAVFALLCFYWTFWALLWAAAWTQPGSGAWAPWIALVCVVGNARPVVTRSLAD